MLSDVHHPCSEHQLVFGLTVCLILLVLVAPKPSAAASNSEDYTVDWFLVFCVLVFALCAQVGLWVLECGNCYNPDAFRTGGDTAEEGTRGGGGI
jgi:hypothetical protein